MKYQHLLSWIAGTPWAIEPVKGRQIVDFMAMKAGGGGVSESNIAALQADNQERRNSFEALAGGAGGGGNSNPAVFGLYGVVSPRAKDIEATSGPGGTSAEGLARRISLAAQNTRVNAIILDVDSPGGSVFGVAECAAAIREAKASKPVIAVVNHFCASAAYWIASQCDEIVMTESSQIGSIGVMIYRENVAKALAKKGIEPDLITFGDFKGEGHPAFPFSDASRKHLEGQANDFGQMFLVAVASGRGVSPKVVQKNFGQGRMVMAARSIELGMADRFGTLQSVYEEYSGQNQKPTNRVGASRASGGTSRERRLKLAAARNRIA